MRLSTYCRQRSARLADRAGLPLPVCTENSVRVDYVSESPNVSSDDRSVLPLPGPVRLAVQVEEPT
jgi:hypothetical protein